MKMGMIPMQIAKHAIFAHGGALWARWSLQKDLRQIMKRVCSPGATSMISSVRDEATLAVGCQDGGTHSLHELPANR